METEYITLTMLERTHGSSLYHKEKHSTFSLRVISNEMHLSPNIWSAQTLTNLRLRLGKIGFVLKRIVPQGGQEVS